MVKILLPKIGGCWKIMSQDYKLDILFQIHVHESQVTNCEFESES